MKLKRKTVERWMQTRLTFLGRRDLLVSMPPRRRDLPVSIYSDSGQGCPSYPDTGRKDLPVSISSDSGQGCPSYPDTGRRDLPVSMPIWRWMQTMLAFVLLSISVTCLAALPPVIVNENDGGEMVLIPAGVYLMGSTSEQTAALVAKDARLSPDFFHAESPQHSVQLSDFYIDRHPVTNAQYAAFMAATGYPAPKYWIDAPQMGAAEPFPIGSRHGSHPVVGISYADALAYCKWAGKRLPTEAEWEKAARGGLVNQQYPWGNEPSRNYANTGGVWGKDRWFWTAAVGSFLPNAYGLSDMAGNVFEWCADWYAADYYPQSPSRNPRGPETGQTRVLRGGSWSNNILGIYQMRCAYRFHARPDTRNLIIGFRCALTP